MTDVLIQLLRETLPDELAATLTPFITRLENADFQSILEDPLLRLLLGHEKHESLNGIPIELSRCWSDCITDRLQALLSKATAPGNEKSLEILLHRQYVFLIAGLAALGAFIQSNVTGPLLPFVSATLLFPQGLISDEKLASTVRQTLVDSLGVDGEAAYKLTPNVELFCLAKSILTCQSIVDNIVAARWAQLRLAFLHQRLLSGISPSLQKSIYEHLDIIARSFLNSLDRDTKVSFLLERATIHTHHGSDKLARADLDTAAKERNFEFALTGLLGKRTRYQQKDVSQLVILAHSKENTNKPSKEGNDVARAMGDEFHTTDIVLQGEQPRSLNLDDDTLLESISFSEQPKSSLDAKDATGLSTELASLNPEKQPLLHPLDSIILLSLAASITNTQPAQGLTREETLPYATRVLNGGSSNWQVYTQALLLRSRIEGYKSRTVERGLLQLQAVVDQVVADTTSLGNRLEDEPIVATTFLPKPTQAEAAPANQRLQYIHQMLSPTRWELQAELAARWVSLGGLRSALEIYERLEMWPEVALCWAATERDDKAKKIVRKQLFHASDGDDEKADDDTELWNGVEREPAPGDAPRLYCILADIDKDHSFYEKAWEVSKGRYARAQRSLGKLYYGERDYAKASNAFSKSLKVKQLDHPTWFAYGCALLELGEFRRAAEAFSRAVQLDDTDAESWSNLAAALLNLEAEDASALNVAVIEREDWEDEKDVDATRPQDPQQHAKDALKALKQASKLKHDNHRIWENILTVAASISPPSWSDIVVAQRRLIELRGPAAGEQCIDVKIAAALLKHVASTIAGPEDLQRPGLPRMLDKLFEESIIPLITASAALWHLVAELSLLRDKPGAALDAHEKAWRAVTTQPGWEHGTEKQWDDVVDATINLVNAYTSLGSKISLERLGSDERSVVANDWKFKSRSAIRGVLGRGKSNFEGTPSWERLVSVMEGLKSSG